MREYSKEQIQDLVFERTPIDDIIKTNEGYGFVDVTGYAGKDLLSFRFYDNGTVTER